MESKESTCDLNLRKFPTALRKRLNRLAVELERDVQDFVPKWLQERVEQEEEKLGISSKRSAKQK